MAGDRLRHVLRETGLMRWPAFYRDAQFYWALAAGVVVLWGVWLWLPRVPSVEQFGVQRLLSVVVWQPIIEEILFRGVIQTQLDKLTWAARKLLGISLANVATSVLFILVHFVHHPPTWAVAVFVPSLVFGYFRDRHQSLYSPIVVHSFYNLGYLLVVSP